jgi:hypothetical protein
LVPDFEGSIGARDSELLLQYLTAPYLRVPLMLKFFCSEGHLRALKVPALQSVLDAVMFEPGPWQYEYVKDSPTVIPASSKDHLSTPAGLLFNEIMFAPQVIMQSTKEILESIIDMDTGRYSLVSEAILYVIRLVVRIEGTVHGILLADRV